MERSESAMWNESTKQAESKGDGLATDDEDVRVCAWRAQQLQQLGVSWLVAHTFAPLVDWHEVAALVDRGCAPALALEIVL